MDNKIWQDFSKSSEFTTLKKYRTSDIKFILQNFFQLMESTGNGDMSKWDEDLIFGLLMAVVEQSDNDESEDFNSTLISFYDAVRAFLRFASKQQLISISFKDMREGLNAFESQTGLEGEPILDESDVDNISYAMNLMERAEANKYADPTLPEWRDYVAGNIDEYTSEWIDAYLESGDFEKRAKGVDADLVEMTMSTLTSKAYDIYRKTPKSWTKHAIHGVLTGYFVSNLNLTTNDYKLVVPALTGLLTYVAEQGWISDKKVDNYKRYLVSSEAEMIRLAADPNSFGPSKTIVNKMIEQGIDMNDDDAVQAFIQQVNDNGGIDSLYDDNRISDYVKDVLTDDEVTLTDDQVVRAAKYFDPDPEKDYLNEQHSKANGDRYWKRENAVETHALGIQYGIKLWMRRKDYSLLKDVKGPEVIVHVGQLVDILYAQDIEEPREWTVSTWKGFSSWMKKEWPTKDYNHITPIFKSLIDMLKDDKILKPQIAEGIIKCL